MRTPAVCAKCSKGPDRYGMKCDVLEVCTYIIVTTKFMESIKNVRASPSNSDEVIFKKIKKISIVVAKTAFERQANNIDTIIITI